MSATMPLQVLADRLVFGPPSLNSIIDLFQSGEAVKAFLALVREYLPEHEREIMTEAMDDRAERFSNLFSQRYFPLADRVMDEIDLDSFVTFIPVDLFGMSYDDYHDFESFRPGYILLISLVVYPYVQQWEGPGGTVMVEDGGRVPIIEEVGRLVGKELASQIPEKGWAPEELHQMTDGTQYDGVAAAADWVCGCTGCWQLDATYDGYSEEIWSRQVVEGLTEQWPRVEEIQDKIMHLAEWLEEAPKANFTELLSFLLGKQVMIVPKGQLSLPLERVG